MRQIGFYCHRKRCFILALGIFILLWTACTVASPLFGTWSDNRGNTLSFYEDNKFSAKINSNNVIKNYEGNYSVLLNSLTLTCTNETLTIVTEWDLRGNMLYLDWPLEDGSASSLTLYKISN